jgi:tetratricopeptide (TPR) repeat protein
MKDFYISYHAADLHHVEWITREIELAGYTILAQAWNRKPKATFTSEIASALQYAQNVLLILSPEYLDIPCTLDEWVETLSIDTSNSSRRILPIQVKSCVLSHLLPNREYLNLADVTTPKTKANLIKVLSYFFVGSLSNGSKEKTFLSPTFIKPMPRVWDIPFFKNPNFIGRESLLAEIAGFFTPENEDDRIIAIYGPGGVGKTTLAVEYAYRYSDRYSVVLFIKAEARTSLEMDLLYLAKRLGLCDEKANDIPRALKLLNNWLSVNKDWLLIFDNMEQPDSIFEYISNNLSGDIIITTRNASENKINSLKMPVLNREESRELLAVLTDQTDDKSLDSIAQILGDLPLALEQVGAFIDQNDYTLSEYLKILQDPSNELGDKITPTEDYPDKLTTAFELTFKKIEEKSPIAMEILNIIAFLAPDDIPIFVLKDSKDLARYFELTDFEQIKDILSSSSIVDFQADSMSIHRLVRKFLIDRLDQTNKCFFFVKAVWIILDSFKYGFNMIDSWSNSIRLIPHIQVLLKYSKATGFYNLKFAHLLNGAGRCLLETCHYPLAKEFFEQALVIKESILGSSHPDITRILCSLGIVIGKMSDWVKAKEYFERAIDIDKKFYGNLALEVAQDLACLGMASSDLGDLQPSYQYLKEALRVIEAIFIDSCYGAILYKLNYGSVLGDLGKFEEAMYFFEKVLDSYEKLWGENHHSVSNTLEEIAVLQINNGKIDAAIANLERAYEINKKLFRPDHIRIGNNFINFGKIFLAKGQPEKALQFFKRAISIIRQLFDDNHKKIAEVMVLMGKATKDCGFLIEARIYFIHAIAIYRKNFPDDNRYIKSIKEDLEQIKLALS